jgi:transposase-like protein
LTESISYLQIRRVGPATGTAIFHSRALPRSQRYDERITEDIAAGYLTGISTRTLSLLTKKLIGRSLSATEVSNAAAEFAPL